MSVDINMSVTGNSPEALNVQQKLSSALGLLGIFIMTLSGFNIHFQPKIVWVSLSLIMVLAGIFWYSKVSYAHKTEGIKNDRIYFKSLTNRGFWAYILGLALTGFYIVLYFYPNWIGLSSEGENTGVVALFDPLSKAISGNAASQWFVYGTLYTLAIVGFGCEFLWKYRHNRYQRLRTFSSYVFPNLGFVIF